MGVARLQLWPRQYPSLYSSVLLPKSFACSAPLVTPDTPQRIRRVAHLMTSRVLHPTGSSRSSAAGDHRQRGMVSSSPPKLLPLGSTHQQHQQHPWRHTASFSQLLGGHLSAGGLHTTTHRRSNSSQLPAALDDGGVPGVWDRAGQTSGPCHGTALNCPHLPLPRLLSQGDSWHQPPAAHPPTCLRCATRRASLSAVLGRGLGPAPPRPAPSLSAAAILRKEREKKKKNARPTRLLPCLPALLPSPHLPPAEVRTGSALDRSSALEEWGRKEAPRCDAGDPDLEFCELPGIINTPPAERSAAEEAWSRGRCLGKGGCQGG